MLAALMMLVGVQGGVAAQEGDDPEPSVERAAALTKPAIGYMEIYFSGWVKNEDGDYFNDGFSYDFSQSCTAVGVNPNGYWATAAHCIDAETRDGAAGYTFLEFAVQEAINLGLYDTTDFDTLFEFALLNWTVEGQAPGSLPEREVYVQQGIGISGLRDRQEFRARVIDYLPFLEGDVALVKSEQSPIPVAELAEDARLPVGTDILAIGYPASVIQATGEDLEPSNKDGRISALKTTRGYAVYEISAAVSGGMSGGPTVDLLGRVVGINSFKVARETQPFNFITPVEFVNRLLTRAGVANELGTVDNLYRDGLDSFYAGAYTDAIAAFDQVLERDATHQQAQELRLAAVQQRDISGDQTTTSESPPTTLTPSTVSTPTTAASTSTSAPAVARTPIAATQSEDGGGSSTGLIVAIAAAAVALIGGFVWYANRQKAVAEAAIGAGPTPQVLPPSTTPEPASAPRTEAPPAAIPSPPTEAPPNAVDDQIVDGEIVDDEAHFCVHCGRTMVPGEPFCAHCGTRQPGAG